MLVALTPFWHNCQQQTEREGWVMVIRKQALRPSREPAIPYLTSRSDKTNVEIKLWASPKFVPSPCPLDKEHFWNLWQGDIHVWNVACVWRMLSITFSVESLQILLWIHVSTVVVLKSYVWATFGLSFGTQVAHSKQYHFCSLSLVAVLWILYFRIPDVLPNVSWWWSCFADVILPSLPIPLGDLALEIMARPRNQHWFAGLLVSGCFPPSLHCLGVSPLPTLPFQMDSGSFPSLRCFEFLECAVKWSSSDHSHIEEPYKQQHLMGTRPKQKCNTLVWNATKRDARVWNEIGKSNREGVCILLRKLLCALLLKLLC